MAFAITALWTLIWRQKESTSHRYGMPSQAKMRFNRTHASLQVQIDSAIGRSHRRHRFACRDRAAPSSGQRDWPRLRHPLPSRRYCRRSPRSRVRHRLNEPADVQKSTTCRCDDHLRRGTCLEAGGPCDRWHMPGSRHSYPLLGRRWRLVQRWLASSHTSPLSIDQKKPRYFHTSA